MDIHYGFYRNFFSLCEKNFASIVAKTAFWQNFGRKTKILRFRNSFWVLFISSSGDHINIPNCKNPLELFSRVILSSKGEQARNWARGPKTQNFELLCFEPNLKGRLNMTSEGNPCTIPSRKTSKTYLFMNQVMYMLFLEFWVCQIQALPNFVRWIPNSWILFLISSSMSGKPRKFFHKSRKYHISLILHLLIESSLGLWMKKKCLKNNFI